MTNLALDELVINSLLNQGTVTGRVLTDAYTSEQIATAKGMKLKVFFYFRDDSESVIGVEAWAEPARRFEALWGPSESPKGKFMKMTKFRVQCTCVLLPKLW